MPNRRNTWRDAYKRVLRRGATKSAGAQVQDETMIVFDAANRVLQCFRSKRIDVSLRDSIDSHPSDATIRHRAPGTGPRCPHSDYPRLGSD